MKGILATLFTVLSIGTAISEEVIPLTDFTHEDEVYIQRGWSELQGACALMTIHEVFDYEMESEYDVYIKDDSISILRTPHLVGTICTATENIIATVGVDGRTEFISMKHEEMCYANNSC